MKKKIILLFAILYLISFQKISLSQDLTPEQIYEKVNDCIVVILSYDFDGKFSKQGSGVVISDKGWVVTNYHVFAECEKMEIKHNENLIKYTDIIGVDVEKDILILKINDNTFHSINIGKSDNLKVGQRVYTIGSPLGLENSMSEGIISGIRNVIKENRNLIQITASISPGSSGGAVLNTKGELIGISTLTFKEGQNLNFAIPVSDILKVTLGSYSNKNEIDANNYFYKGETASDNENYSEAILDYTKAIEFKPEYAEAYYNRGLAYYHLKEYFKAISDYSKVIQIYQDIEQVYYNRGTVYMKLNEYSKAISDFTKAIEINPNYSDAYCNRGFAYEEGFQEYSKAIADYDKAIEINPYDAEAYYNRGTIYDDLNEYSRAIAEYDKAIEIKPEFAEAYYNRGSAYSNMKNYSKAMIDFTKAIEINPNIPEAYYNRGLIYYYFENKYKACEDWRKAYSLGITNAKDLLDKYCK
jgi:tetratricopeptide (TPR) repeat protein